MQQPSTVHLALGTVKCFVKKSWDGSFVIEIEIKRAEQNKREIEGERESQTETFCYIVCSLCGTRVTFVLENNYFESIYTSQFVMDLITCTHSIMYMFKVLKKFAFFVCRKQFIRNHAPAYLHSFLLLLPQTNNQRKYV